MKYPNARQILLLISLVVLVHNFKSVLIKKINRFNYYPSTDLASVFPAKNSANSCNKPSCFEMLSLKRDIRDMQARIDQLESALERFVTPEQIDSKLDLFLADQIGIFDFAAEYAGASVVSTPDTIPYPSKHDYLLFGLFYWTVESKPQLVIQPTKQPGDCFAFHGDKGRILIKLPRAIRITNISVEHVKIEGDILNSAPRDFQIWGNFKYLLGNFTYDRSGRAVQTFNTMPTNGNNNLIDSLNYVEMRIRNNHGNVDFTCVYRFRVHSIFV